MLTTFRRRSDILKVSLTKRIDIEYRCSRWMQSPNGIGIALGRGGQIVGTAIHPASHWLPEWLLAEPKSFINSDDGRTITFGSDQRMPVASMPARVVQPDELESHDCRPRRRRATPPPRCDPFPGGASSNEPA